jgi:hypothetical protein
MALHSECYISRVDCCILCARAQVKINKRKRKINNNNNKIKMFKYNIDDIRKIFYAFR